MSLNIIYNIKIEGATLIHGHQIIWGDDMAITVIPYKIETPILFLGHIDQSRIFVGGEKDKKLQRV